MNIAKMRMQGRIKANPHILFLCCIVSVLFLPFIRLPLSSEKPCKIHLDFTVGYALLLSLIIFVDNILCLSLQICQGIRTAYFSIQTGLAYRIYQL